MGTMTTKARKLKTPNIREGDTVRIVTPDFFVRCGYPLCFEGETARVLKEQGEAINAFLRSQGVQPPRIMGDMSHPQQKVAKAIAYCLLRQKKFGGSNRMIHTERIESRKNETAQVVSVSFVKTGIYSPGYRDHDGEYESAYLSDEKTHRILTLDIQGQLTSSDYHECLRIDAENVELLDTPEHPQ